MAGTDETALKIRQNGDLRRRFRRKVNGVYQPFTGVVVKSQIRDRVGPSGKLLLDLGPYFTVNADDATILDLLVPGTVTATLTTDGVWDIFFDGAYITGGPVDLRLSATQ